MVRFWRRRNASAPCRIASEISRIAGVPVSRRSTQRASSQATPSEPIEQTRIRGRALAGDIDVTPSLRMNRRSLTFKASARGSRWEKGHPDAFVPALDSELSLETDFT